MVRNISTKVSHIQESCLQMTVFFVYNLLQENSSLVVYAVDSRQDELDEAEFSDVPKNVETFD